MKPKLRTLRGSEAFRFGPAEPFAGQYQAQECAKLVAAASGHCGRTTRVQRQCDTCLSYTVASLALANLTL